MGGFAWVTLATNDSYSLGALVLAHSLRRAATKHDLVVLITPGVTQVMREKLGTVFNLVQEVNVLDSKEEANLALLARPELGITFTKLHCWRLTQYEKCVFVDADALVIRNCDELFEREELSAAPDVGWPDCFNSGVFVFKPSQQTFASITAFAADKGSFDGGDQGLLNSYFSDWAHKDIAKHLPFIYNMCSTATYSYLPAYKQYGDDVRIIHFIGSTKPWLQYFDTETNVVHPPSGCNHLQPLLQLWWNIFCDNVHSQLSPVMAGIAGALAKMSLGEPRNLEQAAFEEHMRRQGWEQGQIDYMGKDSFDNIWKKICTTINQFPEQGEPSEDKQESSILRSESTPVAEPTPEAKPSSTTAIETEDITDSPSPSKDLAATLAHQDIQTPALQDQLEILADVKPESAEIFVVEKTENVETQSSTVLTETQSPTQDQDQTEEKSQSYDISEVGKITPVLEAESSLVENAEIQPVGEIVAEQFVSTFEAASTTLETDGEVKSESAELVLDNNSVPIQVAESVLQSEPKESVTEDPRPVEEEVISSVVASVQESATAVSETVAEPDEEQEKDVSKGEKINNGNHSELQPDVPEVQAVVEPEVSQPAPVSEGKPQVPANNIQETEPEDEPLSLTSNSSKSASLTPPDSPSTECPVRPARTRDPKVPTTPTVIEATPPNSPPIGVEQNLEDPPKIVKKVVKKVTKTTPSESDSVEGSEGEVSGKKVVKKVIKKVVKKVKEPEDHGGEGSGTATEKPKKVVKIVKKFVKPLESLDVDTSVPETPPAGVPVPPKRKVKTTTTTTTTRASPVKQLSESEP